MIAEHPMPSYKRIYRVAQHFSEITFSDYFTEAAGEKPNMENKLLTLRVVLIKLIKKGLESYEQLIFLIWVDS